MFVGIVNACMSYLSTVAAGMACFPLANFKGVTQIPNLTKNHLLRKIIKNLSPGVAGAGLTPSGGNSRVTLTHEQHPITRSHPNSHTRTRTGSPTNSLIHAVIMSQESTSLSWEVWKFRTLPVMIQIVQEPISGYPGASRGASPDCRSETTTALAARATGE